MLRVIRRMSLLVVLCLSNAAVFGADPDQATKQLVGTQAREWVFQRFDPFMGSGHCTKGEIYVFKADHTVVISRCIRGKVQDETQPWSIDGNQLETRLTVGAKSDAKSYVLIFEDNSRGHFMRLRTKPKVITGRTIDRVFRLIEE